MASKWPPVKNAGFTFRVYLFAQSDNQIKTSPTLAAGDFQVSTDGGAFANLGTTPSESPASSGQVLVTLTAAEMNGDEVTVRAIDASGAEWHSAAWVIHTVGQTLDTIDGNVDSILTDTGTTLPATLTTIDGIVDDILLDTAAIASLNDLDATEVQTAAAAALTAYDPPTKAELDSAVAPLATAAALTTHDGKLDTVDGIVDAILVDTNELQTNQGNWLTATGFSTHDAAAVVTALESTQLPDSTPAVGARPTWGQALLGASRFMMEKEVTGATLTVYKEDGTTAVMTFTLDDGDAPTSITRAS